MGLRWDAGRNRSLTKGRLRQPQRRLAALFEDHGVKEGFHRRCQIPLTLKARRALHEHLATGTAKSFFTLLMRTKSVHLYLGFLLISGYTLAGVFPRLSR